MERCLREMTFEEEYTFLNKEAKELFDKEDRESEPPKSHCVVRRALRCIKKLVAELEPYKEYKDLDEQGLLLRLPCKIDSPLYRVYKKPTKCTAYGEYKDDYAYACQGCEEQCNSSYVWDIYKYEADIKTILCLSDELGKTVFLTKEEAEQKLKEMKCD